MKEEKSVKKKFSSAKPFPHIVLRGVLDESFASNVLRELKNEVFHEKFSDLFHFYQTDDLAFTKNNLLKKLHDYFSSEEFLVQIEKITGKKNLTYLDMAGTLYKKHNYLLPHDDKVENRKLAFILYLSKRFTKEDGGVLNLYKGTSVAKEIVPVFNSLVIFDIKKRPVHEVAEVISNKKRYAISGWFG